MIVNINTAVAFILNNLFIVAAGGLIAVWLGWRMWQKVESLVGRFQSWQDLGFWAVKLVVVVAVLFRVGGWIFTNVNTAVVAAVNSPSIQQTGQALVGLGAAADQLIGWDGSAPASGGLLTADYQVGGAVNLLSAIAPAVTNGNAVFTAPDGKTYEVTIPDASALELQPLNQMFKAAETQVQSAAVNASIGAPAQAPTGEYIVQPGDSLAAIASRMGINLAALCQANRLSNCNVISVGQRLVMPGAVAKSLNETVSIETSAKIRTVRTGTGTAYTAPKLNQSYIPPTWNVLEQGEMSVGDPAAVSSGSSEVFASFPTN